MTAQQSEGVCAARKIQRETQRARLRKGGIIHTAVESVIHGVDQILHTILVQLRKVAALEGLSEKSRGFGKVAIYHTSCGARVQYITFPVSVSINGIHRRF